MKTVMYVLAVVMLSLVCNMDVQAQSKKEVKQAKIRTKELMKEGWKVEGSSTLQNAIARVESQRGTKEILIGSTYGSKKLNLAKAKARNNAINEYAEYGKSMVKGRINTELQDISEEEADNFVEAFERMVVRELEGEISVPEVVLYRGESGNYDVQCFFLIDENRAAKMRANAMKKALEEANIAHEYGNKISNFIKEGFDNAK
ncbi:MAG: hypothetical protein NC410_07135 [Oscillibacter sp.]|nr:hypothetical protein [Oscillibacter sp.]